jgi:transposase-like protein
MRVSLNKGGGRSLRPAFERLVGGKDTLKSLILDGYASGMSHREVAGLIEEVAGRKVSSSTARRWAISYKLEEQG